LGFGYLTHVCSPIRGYDCQFLWFFHQIHTGHFVCTIISFYGTVVSAVEKASAVPQLPLLAALPIPIRGWKTTFPGGFGFMLCLLQLCIFVYSSLHLC
jgi:hypothetical protein